MIFSPLTFAVQITGTAKIGDQLLYTEIHQAEISPNGTYLSLSTEYFDKDQKLTGKMQSNYSYSPISPNYLFEDVRGKKTEKVTIDQDKKNLLIEKTEKNITYKSKIELKNDSIAGLGFHNFLVNNYESLIKSGGSVHFINTEKVDQYKFEISILKRENGQTWFKVIPSNLIYRAFIPPMVLCYEDQSKRVQSFEGLSNIKDQDGKLQKVVIQYKFK